MHSGASDKRRMATNRNYGLADESRRGAISGNRRNSGMRIGKGISRNRIWEGCEFLFSRKLSFTRGLLLTITPCNFAQGFVLGIRIVRSLLCVLFPARARLLTLASLDARLIVEGQNRFAL